MISSVSSIWRPTFVRSSTEVTGVTMKLVIRFSV